MGCERRATYTDHYEHPYSKRNPHANYNEHANDYFHTNACDSLRPFSNLFHNSLTQPHGCSRNYLDSYAHSNDCNAGRLAAQRNFIRSHRG